MSNTWIGGAPAVNQIDTLTVGSNTNGQTFIVKLAHPSGAGTAVTMGTYTAGGSDTTDEIADAIYHMLTTGTSAGTTGISGSGTLTHNHPWVRALSFSLSSSVVTVTANVPGVPFVLSTTGSTGTFTRANSTANSGPNDYSVAGNWGEGEVPAANADIVIQGSHSILYGLQPTPTTDTFTVRNFTGGIGWPEYPLAVEADEQWLFDCPNAKPLYIVNSDTSLTLPLIQVYNTGPSEPYGLYIGYSVALGGALTRMDVGGSSRVLFYGYDGSDVTAALVNVIGGATFDVGKGGIAITLNILDGDSVIQPFGGAPTTLTLNRGSLQIDGALAVTTATVNGGRFIPNSTGTITTLNHNGGIVDLLQSRSTRTITTANLDQAGTLLMDTANVTIGAFNRTGPLMYRSAVI